MRARRAPGDASAAAPPSRPRTRAGREPATWYECAGCGARLRHDEPPFRCPNAGEDDGANHLLVKHGDLARMRFPKSTRTQPFLRYRELFHSWQAARAAGLPDEQYVSVVEDLDRAIAAVDGSGFEVTPFGRSEGLSRRLGLEEGGVWVKDETQNVAGSHKARHLMGIAIWLQVADACGFRPRSRDTRLAIASCGNAALAAAVVARALDSPLDVFVPLEADLVILAELERLGAKVHPCPRLGDTPGDPCLRAFRAAVRAGALPFGCQGHENGLTIEGGETLGDEIATTLAARGERLDRVFIQVGGGALASATVQALARAFELGAIDHLPTVHAVQASGCAPLARAFERLRDHLAAAAGLMPGDPRAGEVLRERFEDPAIREARRDAAAHGARFMRPWHETPHSIAHGILDDETYDWLVVAEAMLATGGFPVVVSEERLVEAHRMGRQATGSDVSATGSAGLAGLAELRRSGLVAPDERVAVLFTGREPRPVEP